MEGILPNRASINKLPGFDREHYSFWKAKFKIFLIATEYDLWQVIEDGNYVLQKMVEGRQVPKTPAELMIMTKS